MDTYTIEDKLLDHLREPAFQELLDDPTPQYDKSANKLLIDLSIDAGLDHTQAPLKHLFSHFSNAPQMYPMAKDHKATFPNTKVRVVQPITNSSIEKLDMVVSRVLVQVTQKLPNRVKSSADFITKLWREYPHDLAVSGNWFQASLDVENMYPTMPTDERALGIIHQYLTKYKDSISLFGFNIPHILEMLKFILSHTYTKSGNKYFLQKIGIGTGSHSSGAYAEIIIDDLYNQASTSSADKPS